ncbi:MAG: Gfo/Idh/MocA family protein [Candidatus Bathyarchaeia archaeon]
MNAAVIGCGNWGKNHARVYRILEEVHLDAVIDVDEARARDVGECYGARWSTDIGMVLEDDEIDIVSVCTSTDSHYSVALSLMESDKHVIVEKPPAETVEEAQNLIRYAQNRGVHLSVGFLERFNPCVIEAINQVSKGSIGAIILAHSRRISRKPARFGDIDVIKDLAIHDIDLLSLIFQGEPEYVFSRCGSLDGRYEDYANIIISYGRNETAFVEANWHTPRKIRELVITGTRGQIRAMYQDQELVLEDEKGCHTISPGYREPLFEELRSFARSVMLDISPVITGIDGLKALRICEAALQSSATGMPSRIMGG